MVSWLDKRGIQSQKIFDNRKAEDTLLFGWDLGTCSSPTWLLTAEILPRSIFHCHNSLILFVFEAYFSNSKAAFCTFFNIDIESFLYAPQSLSFLFLFYFISTSGLTILFVLNFSIFGFDLLFSPSFFPLFLSFLMSESLSFGFSFQNQVPDLPFISLISVVLSLSSSILSCAKLKTKLTSTFLFFEDKTTTAFTYFSCMRWCFDGMIVRLGK